MHHPVGPSQDHNDAVERVLRQAEMSRLTRNLKSKLALASMQAQHGPGASQTPPPAGAGQRKRAKTLEGASSAPRFMAASEPARRPSQQKRHSLPSAGSAGSPLRQGSTSYRFTPGSRNSSRPASRPSSGPPSRTPSLSAIPPMPALPSVFAGDGSSTSYSSDPVEDHRQDANDNGHRGSNGTLMDAPVFRHSSQDQGEDRIPEPPSTPPQRRRALNTAGDVPQTPERGRDHEDGASLLLHFAHSPGHVATPRTPDFNMSDYLHFQTPSPARPARMATPRRLNHWGSLTSLSSLSSNIFVPAGGTSESAGPTPVKASTLLSPAQRPPMPVIPSGSHLGLEKSPSDL